MAWCKKCGDTLAAFEVISNDGITVDHIYRCLRCDEWHCLVAISDITANQLLERNIFPDELEELQEEIDNILTSRGQLDARINSLVYKLSKLTGGTG